MWLTKITAKTNNGQINLFERDCIFQLFLFLLPKGATLVVLYSPSILLLLFLNNHCI